MAVTSAISKTPYTGPAAGWIGCVFGRMTMTLTARELEVAVLVAEGLSNKEIARRLDHNEDTVKIHLHNIYEKLGVRNRTSLAVKFSAGRQDRSVGEAPAEAF
jgi:DNA-binding NarL/FixJ family response regulator